MSRGGAGRKPAPEEPARPLRLKWLAALVGTVLATIGFWLIVLGASDDLVSSGGPLIVGFGAALMVLSVAALAVVSGAVSLRARTLRAITIAGAVFAGLVAVTVVLGQLLPFAAVTVISLGAGGTVSLAGEGPAVVGGRLWAVVVVTGITLGLVLIAGVAGAFAATLLPYNALVIADMWADRSLA